MGASFLFPSVRTLAEGEALSAPSGIAEALRTLLTNAVRNPVASLANANYIGVLVGCMLAVALAVNPLIVRREPLRPTRSGYGTRL